MEAISRTTEDYLKVIWAAGEWGGDAATVKELSNRFGTTRASASSTVKRLVAQGLLLHEPYGPILLTPDGNQLALKMVRRHRLLETYLVGQLGYTWDEVHDEAETLEHAASDLMIDRIDDLLGNPRIDPHGDPIPTRSGEVTYSAGAERVSTAAPGAYRVIRISDDSPTMLGWFESIGLGMGNFLSVTGRDGETTVIDLDGQEHQLTHETAAAVVVVIP